MKFHRKHRQRQRASRASDDPLRTPTGSCWPWDWPNIGGGFFSDGSRRWQHHQPPGTARPAPAPRWRSWSRQRAALATCLLLAPWIALRPLAALAVVGIVYSSKLIRLLPSSWRSAACRAAEFHLGPLWPCPGRVFLGNPQGHPGGR